MDSLSELDYKANIFVTGIDERVKDSVSLIKNDYPAFQQLEHAMEFMSICHSDAVKSDIENLERLGYYPATETELELDHAIKHALIGSYKAAFSDLRRALELTIVSILLSSKQVPKTDAIDWIQSKNKTPFFSTAVDKIIKEPRFKELNDGYKWKDNIKQLYWNISDFGHNKGTAKGYRELNKFNAWSNDTVYPLINKETLFLFCDFYIETVQEIVVMLAMYNPMILVGVPLDEKYGLNPPLSGYFQDGQAELTHILIPSQYKEYFKNVAEYDSDVKSVVEWINSLPDLTAEELRIQSKNFEDMFSPKDIT